MKTHFRFIEFKPENGAWVCRNNKHGSVLGRVEWFEPWKRWVFQCAEADVIFSSDCLRDIAEFMDGLKEGRDNG